MEPNPHAAVESCANLRKKLSKDELKVDALVSPSPLWLQWYRGVKVFLYCRGWSPNYSKAQARGVCVCCAESGVDDDGGGGGLPAWLPGLVDGFPNRSLRIVRSGVSSQVLLLLPRAYLSRSWSV